MDTKLRADIAESAVVTELLSRGYRVLKPVGDRLPYDLAVDLDGRLVRIQVKHAWFDKGKELHLVDARRTNTNRRRMIRRRYSNSDFDFAIVYLTHDGKRHFYIMPVEVFMSYGSTVGFVVDVKRQRPPKSDRYREQWDLLSKWAAHSVTNGAIPVKFGEALTGDTEPSPPVM